MGAELYLDEAKRPIEDQSPLLDFFEYLKRSGHNPYLIPAGASEHKFGSFGYMACAAEIILQSRQKDIQFDYVVHCTGSSSTQAGLVAGFAFMGEDIKVIGVADDDETDIKRGRVLKLANDSLAEVSASVRVSPTDIEIISADQSVYGEAEPETFDAIRLLARSEGLVADPVYEGKALRGLQKLAGDGRFESDSRILLMHLGGTPAVHAYANQFGKPDFSQVPAI
jgi:1-aminocyclopropane-1-carboxylate deaminase/D-cysteine desulfhydrase-like pyridoxal-dependent ACC family enzyme